ncbi:MAG TPA: hypothetical protein VFW92_10435 [Candidatus Limnocylindrales bacterium]|nr:hypothetical protein [Candidatus Limnocylindrales bacterium]
MGVKRAAWEPQPGETSPAYAAFVLYRDMGSARSISKTAEALGRNRTLIGGWSSRWRWQERIAGWEGELSRRALEEETNERRAMVKLHARTARAVINAVARRVVGDEAHGVAAIDPNTLGPQDLARLLDVAVKIERLARGVPSEVVETRASIEADVRRLSSEYDFTEEEIQAAIRDAIRLAGAV